jgi:hypothetical protein
MTLEEIRDAADMAETWPGSRTLEFSALPFRVLVEWAMKSDDVTGFDVESVKHMFERWWRAEKTKPGPADKRAIVDAPCLTEFRVGDIVEATATFRRKDGRSELRPGDEATVRAVWKTTPDSPQIIDLDIEGGLPMGDIVCFEHVPLRLLHSPYASAHPRAAKGGDE